MTAFDLLNSTILGTNPLDPLDNMPGYEPQKLRRELVTWGANRNFVLGLQGDGDRTFPERVQLEKVPTTSSISEEVSFQPLTVKKVAMEKLHSGLLTDEKKNNFRLCGFGSTTGRLGHASHHPQFAFEPLRDFSAQTVTDFALGQDHTILCTDKGDVWTFGLNVSISIHPRTFAESVIRHSRFSAIPSRPRPQPSLVLEMRLLSLRPSVWLAS